MCNYLYYLLIWPVSSCAANMHKPTEKKNPYCLMFGLFYWQEEELFMVGFFC